MRCAWVYKSNSCLLLVSLSRFSLCFVWVFFFFFKNFLRLSSLLFFVCLFRTNSRLIHSVNQSVTVRHLTNAINAIGTSQNIRCTEHIEWKVVDTLFMAHHNIHSGYPYVHHMNDTTLCAYRQFAIRPFTVIRMYHTETHTHERTHARTLRVNEWMTTACVRIANHQNHTFKWYFALATRLTRSTSFCSFSIFVFWFRFCSKVRIHFNPNTAYTTLHHTLCAPSADARDEGETAKEKKKTDFFVRVRGRWNVIYGRKYPMRSTFNFILSNDYSTSSVARCLLHHYFASTAAAATSTQKNHFFFCWWSLCSSLAALYHFFFFFSCFNFNTKYLDFIRRE